MKWIFYTTVSGNMQREGHTGMHSHTSTAPPHRRCVCTYSCDTDDEWTMVCVTRYSESSYFLALKSVWRSAITSESCQHVCSADQEVQVFWSLCVFWAKEHFLYVCILRYVCCLVSGVLSHWEGFLFAMSLQEIGLFWWSCSEAFYFGYAKGL